MPEFFRVVRFEEARALVEACCPPRRPQEVALADSVGRVLARDVTSREDVPAFERSTVDGYAVRARDTFGSSEALPGYLALVGEVLMGEATALALGQGECAWVPTGGMMPAGADAVVMVEHTELLGDDTVLVHRPVGPGENVIRVGEDARAGERVLEAGRRLRPQDVGVLAALGQERVEVLAPLRFGIVSTGDEVVPVDQEPRIGQVRDINSHALAAAVRQHGGIPHQYGIIPDQEAQLRRGLARALAENDVVVISGGSSVGTRDLTLEVLLSLPDAELLFHGVAARPGKPTMAVRAGQQLLLGLPGHPVAALMMFRLLGAPLLDVAGPQEVRAVMASNVASQAGRDDFVRVELSGEGRVQVATPLHGKSGLMLLMARAHGFVHVPYEKQGIAAGEEVAVVLF